MWSGRAEWIAAIHRRHVDRKDVRQLGSILNGLKWIFGCRKCSILDIIERDNMELWEEAWVCVNRWHHQVSNVILLVNHVLYCRPRPYVYTFCHNVWLWTALENPSRVRLDYVYPRPQCCVNTVLYYPSTCKSPCWHSAVSIRVSSTPLHL